MAKQNLLARCWINGSDRRGSYWCTESPQSGNPSVLYLWVGKSKWEKCIAVSSSLKTKAQNASRKLFCLIKIKENCWENEVCLQVPESRQLLSAPIISERLHVCVHEHMCVCTASPRGCNKLKWQFGSLKCSPKFATAEKIPQNSEGEETRKKDIWEEC